MKPGISDSTQRRFPPGQRRAIEDGNQLTIEIDMNVWDAVYPYLDAALIFFYRLPGHSAAGFYLGTLALCMAAVVIGEATYILAYMLNRRHYETSQDEMVHMHNLSIQAITVKDKASFKAANSLANESFGKTFFSQAALFCASLWPVPFLLAWMSLRFRGVGIPFFGATVSYVAVFLPLYILCRFGFSRIKGRLPFFSKAQASMRLTAAKREKLMSWSDLGGKNDESA